MANERSLPTPDGPGYTKDRLLDAALARFARDGWGGTSIRELAADAGIRESSVYKHFPSKQAIFDALLDRADARLAEVATGLGVRVDDGGAAAAGYLAITEEQLTAVALGFFDAMLHDPELSALRRLMVVNQYRDPEIARRLRDYWVTGPLAFQAELFGRLFGSGEFREGLGAEATALAFFGPIHLLLQLADAGPEDEARARELLAKHVRHFRATHLRENR